MFVPLPSGNPCMLAPASFDIEAYLREHYRDAAATAETARRSIAYTQQRIAQAIIAMIESRERIDRAAIRSRAAMHPRRRA
jgi:hypothetical protein